MRWLYNLASMTTGLGITRNIVDCYAAIIALYEEGDRIFLIGFSRGAYTVRSVAGGMTHCGVPRHMPDGSPLRRDPKSIHKLAEHAVKDVYQFCPSYSRKILGYRQFLLKTRDAIATQFRQHYGSTTTVNGAEHANVFPYFIGVFDTVANAASWTKAYVGMHSLEYHGLYNQRSICGTWNLLGTTGEFWIWPDGMGQEEESELELEQPVELYER